MLFSSVLFLFLFLPIVLGLYHVCPRPGRNVLLLIASLIFYAWGEPTFAIIMLFSIVLNYVFGLFADRFRENTMGKVVVAAAVIVNLGLLGYFKYADFTVDNLNVLLSYAGGTPLRHVSVVLPLGISFYTFHALSYVIDVHRGKARVISNPFDLALYIAMFPQLIAGPIIRYASIAEQLVRRSVDVPMFASGIRRFVVGLGKKVLIANSVGQVADAVFGLPANELSQSVAWLGALCYTLQIYFDFSGYSDMAIGLGRMFGFQFMENFNYPYISRSVTEFWRRWHISLSSWFRDYLYIPLGGNRVSASRTYLNLMIVFFLCGLWHGASWTFVLWGLYHGTFLVLERLLVRDRMPGRASPLMWAYTILVVMVGWVLFRAETATQAIQFLSAMARWHSTHVDERFVSDFATRGAWIAIIAGIVGSFPVIPLGRRWIEQSAMSRLQGRPGTILFEGGYELVRLIAISVVFALSVISLSAATYNPFIYFRF